MRFRRSSTAFSERLGFCILVMIPVFLTAYPAPAIPDAVVGILRFKSDSFSGDALAALQSAMLNAARKDKLFKTPRLDSGGFTYDYEMNSTVSPRNCAHYTAICSRLQCNHLLMGRVYTQNKNIFIEAKIFSSSEKKIICAFSEPVSPGTVTKLGDAVVKKVSLYLDGKLPVVTGVEISRGDSSEKVSLSWQCSTANNTFLIFRSCFENGPYLKIGETVSTSFVDTTAEAGLKYWYRATPLINGISGIPAIGYGYRKPLNPKSLTVDEMLDVRCKPWPDPATPEESAREKIHLQLFEKYYESYIMSTFIVMVGKIYINSGSLLAYRDFNYRNYTWEPGKRTMYFMKPGVVTVKFFSRRFFRFVRDMYLMDIPFDELLPRVVGNGILFCVRSGEKEVREPDGKIRYLPNMEAVGMSTEYIRDYEKWKGNTIVFATSDEELYRRIQEAQIRGY